MLVKMKSYKKLEPPFRQPVKSTYCSLTKTKQRLLVDTVSAFLFASWTSTHVRIEHLRGERKEKESNFLQAKALIDSLSVQDLNAVCPVSQQTLLYFSIKNNDNLMFTYLLERGASPFVACQGLTILESVILHRRLNWLKDENIRSTEPLRQGLIDTSNFLHPPTTPLITAASIADEETFTWLLEKGAQLRRNQIIVKQHADNVQRLFKDCLIHRQRTKSLKLRLKVIKKQEEKQDPVQGKRKKSLPKENKKNRKKTVINKNNNRKKINEKNIKKTRKKGEKKKKEEKKEEPITEKNITLAADSINTPVLEPIDDQSLFCLPHLSYDTDFIPDLNFFDSLLASDYVK